MCIYIYICGTQTVIEIHAAYHKILYINICIYMYVYVWIYTCIYIHYWHTDGRRNLCRLPEHPICIYIYIHVCIHMNTYVHMYTFVVHRCATYFKQHTIKFCHMYLYLYRYIYIYSCHTDGRSISWNFLELWYI